MATTRTPLPPAERQELFHTVGCHVYLLRYPKGQEDLARECLYRWVRNRDLAFEWADAATMAEQLPDPPVDDAPEPPRPTHIDMIDLRCLKWVVGGLAIAVGYLLLTR